MGWCRRYKTRIPESGLTLVEVIVALSIFTIISLAVSLTLLRGMEQRRDSFDLYRAHSALRDKVAEIQDVANRPLNMVAKEGIGAIYARYHNTICTVPDLHSGQILITCFSNETTVPSFLGGPQDMNFDGDAQDNLTGDDMRIVPMELSITFSDGEHSRSITTHRLITKTVD